MRIKKVLSLILVFGNFATLFNCTALARYKDHRSHGMRINEMSKDCVLYLARWRSFENMTYGELVYNINLVHQYLKDLMNMPLHFGNTHRNLAIAVYRELRRELLRRREINISNLNNQSNGLQTGAGAEEYANTVGHVNGRNYYVNYEPVYIDSADIVPTKLNFDDLDDSNVE